jgi:CBS domain-containing protein
MTPTAEIIERNCPQNHPAALLLDAIAAATTPASVAQAGRRLPKAISTLVKTGVDPLEVGGAVSGVIDAMTRRLIDLAFSEQGEPPVPWAWLALGSAARCEQGIGTDQDHALAYDPQGRPPDELDAYFLRLAEYVTSGLESAGIPRCHADVVAVNQALRRPVDHWAEAFQTWMADPRIEAVRQTTILFDHRRVAGPLDVERTLRWIISSSPERPAFVGRLRKMAMDARPPRHLRRPRRIDLKHDGLMQIVTLARILAVEGDIPNTGTIERLRGAVSRGLLDESSAHQLAAAFQVMWRIRLEHQIAAAAAREEPGDLVSVQTPQLRTQLGEALGSIREAQGALLQGSVSPARIRRDTRSASLEPAA